MFGPAKEKDVCQPIIMLDVVSVTSTQEETVMLTPEVPSAAVGKAADKPGGGYMMVRDRSEDTMLT